jgi:hypothetical protein
LPVEKNTLAPTSTSNADKKKELRRVYRKLKGVRSQLSVKIRELRKEVRETDSGVDEELDGTLEKDLEPISDQDYTNADTREKMRSNQPRSTYDSMQYEVKSLIDHKRRLRKRYWKLVQQVHSDK